MCLHIDSDNVILVQPKARSRSTGQYFLSDNPPLLAIKSKPQDTGPVHTECITMKRVMSSTVEAEVATIHHNGKQNVASMLL